MDRGSDATPTRQRQTPRCEGSTTPAAAAAPQELLAGRFLLQRRLGEGGMGEVFAAFDTALGQGVAIKVIHPQCAGPQGRLRLAREVLAARHRHPALVEIYDLHEANGRLFLSMELVEGPSLADALREGVTLPFATVVSLGRQLAGALLHLHRHGLIHRDVKPANVLLGSDGAAKLCDLGLTSPVRPAVDAPGGGRGVGTPGFMAPEQRDGRPLTSAVDIYALGLTLYRCLTGWLPPGGLSRRGFLPSGRADRPPRVRQSRPDCPAWLDVLVLRMLDPDPTRRPGAEGVARALQRGARGVASARRVAAAALVVAVAGAAFVSCRSLRSASAAPRPMHRIASQVSLTRV